VHHTALLLAIVENCASALNIDDRPRTSKDGDDAQYESPIPGGNIKVHSDDGLDGNNEVVHFLYFPKDLPKADIVLLFSSAQTNICCQVSQINRR